MSTTSFFEENFKQINYNKESFRNTVYEACTFENCNFAKVNFIDLAFEECEFINCDFTGAFLNETAFREVSFVGCKMIGLNFEGVNPFRLKMDFEESILDYAIFHGMKLIGVNMINCSLKECDFTRANFQKAIFTGSNLTNALFEQTNLIEADFRSSENYSINPGSNQVKGARFSKDGLMGLLREFKIKVED